MTHATTDHADCFTRTISDELRTFLIDRHRRAALPGYQRLWEYYRNELDFEAGDDRRPYTAAQQQGLPSRLTRAPGEARRLAGVGGGRREVVIENDIAWRIHTLVDFMFAKPVVIQSLAEDRAKAAAIERALAAVFEANGGVCFFQNLALLGAVYGHVDVLLRVDAPARHRIDESFTSSAGISTGDGAAGSAPSNPFPIERAAACASHFVLETVEAPRAIPVLNPADYRRLDAYLMHYTQWLNEVDRSSFLSRLVDFNGKSRARQATRDVTEVWTAEELRLYHDGALAAVTPNVLGRLPVVHIQNLPQPFFYEGLSEVEPLIPLQDELNTRLSDRANRVTMQSFKMYLGKGIEHFNDRAVGPGQMWMTDNTEASIESFGGDADSPSETAHIQEIRDALDKTSAVTPLAAGLLRSKVGNLTSENALRIVLMGLLARTEKKRVTYGKGIEQVCELLLEAMAVTGVLPTGAAERRVRLHWPSPLPQDERQRLLDAELKLRIGVPRHQVLAELGYGEADDAA